VLLLLAAPLAAPLPAPLFARPSSSAPALPPPPLAAPPLGGDTAPAVGPSDTHALRNCVMVHGNLGCASRLYAELLCRVVGAPRPVQTLEPLLARQYALAQIDFTGLSAQAVESAAVSEQVPQICPARSWEIQALFAPLLSSPPAAD
jgi:hypothetical protein